MEQQLWLELRIGTQSPFVSAETSSAGCRRRCVEPHIPEGCTFAFLGLFFIVSPLGTLVYAQPVIEDHGAVSTELTVIRLGATALQTGFMAGDTLLQVRVEALGTGLPAHAIQQEEVRQALWGKGGTARYAREPGGRNWLPLHRASLFLTTLVHVPSTQLPHPYPARAHSQRLTSPASGGGATHGCLLHDTGFVH